MTRNILITGAAGTGTTTLARALAHELRATHLEADVFLWLPSYPPYQHQVEKRSGVSAYFMRCAAQAGQLSPAR